MTRTCDIEGCQRIHRARGLCGAHYESARAKGALPPIPTPEQKFWAKVDKSGECWMWTGTINMYGYGDFYFNGRNQLASRVSYEIANGEVPRHMVVDHICRTPRCVRPDHIRLATQSQNQQHRTVEVNGSKSGIRGVRWDKVNRKWCASVTHMGRRYWLGRFSDIESAAKAARDKRNELFTHNDLDRIEP